ncbi:MAG: BTAD domain-containing putative transcriptional regulator [Clostridium sp.]
MKHQTLYVNMLGNFSLKLGEIPISLNCKVTGKRMQLLILLLQQGNKGITRSELLERLYGREENTDPANSLRAAVFRLRKTLTETGFFDENCISTEKGIYRWSDDTTVMTDAYEFTVAANAALEANTDVEANREESIRLLKYACELYTGEFLPMLSEEAWVAAEGEKYRKLYFACIKEACMWMKQQHDYKDILALCTKASDLYPFEEWEVLQIDSLIAMKQYKKALGVYEDATDLFFRELGLSPYEKVLAQFRAMSGRIHYETGTITDIKDSLRAHAKTEGAFYCTYPNFIDCYRLIVRMIERSGQSIFLILCTLMDSTGKSPAERKIPSSCTEKMDFALKKALRKGDLYTRYSSDQFLVMLIGSAQESCHIATERIDRIFQEGEAESKVRISYCLTSIAESNDPTKTDSFTINSFKRR